MRNIFADAAKFVGIGIVKVRLAHGGERSGVGADRVFDALDTMGGKMKRLTEAFDKEPFLPKALFIGAAMRREDFVSRLPRTMDELIGQIKTARDLTRPMLAADDIGQSMARLHFATENLTGWYDNQDRRALGVIDSVMGKRLAPNFLMSLVSDRPGAMLVIHIGVSPK